MTAKEWRDANPDLKGNIRDHAEVNQLLVLANIESLNAEFIHMKLTSSDRITRLHEVATRQLLTLNNANPALTHE